MKTVIWDDTFSVPDEAARGYAQKLTERDTIFAGTEAVVDWVRWMVVHDVIEDVSIVYNDKLYPLNQYGVILDWPEGLADTSANVSSEILRAAINKKRASRDSKSAF